MKITTRIIDILQSELINSGKNEFYNEGQLTFFNNSEDFSFIQKAIKYDTDIEEIVNKKFFRNVTLDMPTSDKKFKRMFINKFLDREIGYQTLESFSAKITYFLLAHLDYINHLFDNLDDYILGQSNTRTDGQGNSITDNRNAHSELPQDEININVDNTILNYANNNTINRNKRVSDDTSNTKSERHSLDELLKTKSLIDDLFEEMDRRYFLQVFL